MGTLPYGSTKTTNTRRGDGNATRKKHASGRGLALSEGPPPGEALGVVGEAWGGPERGEGRRKVGEAAGGVNTRFQHQ